MSADTVKKGDESPAGKTPAASTSSAAIKSENIPPARRPGAVTSVAPRKPAAGVAGSLKSSTSSSTVPSRTTASSTATRTALGSGLTKPPARPTAGTTTTSVRKPLSSTRTSGASDSSVGKDDSKPARSALASSSASSTRPAPTSTTTTSRLAAGRPASSTASGAISQSADRRSTLSSSTSSRTPLSARPSVTSPAKPRPSVGALTRTAGTSSITSRSVAPSVKAAGSAATTKKPVSITADKPRVVADSDPDDHQDDDETAQESESLREKLAEEISKRTALEEKLAQLEKRNAQWTRRLDALVRQPSEQPKGGLSADGEDGSQDEGSSPADATDEGEAHATSNEPESLLDELELRLSGEAATHDNARQEAEQAVKERSDELERVKADNASLLAEEKRLRLEREAELEQSNNAALETEMQHASERALLEQRNTEINADVKRLQQEVNQLSSLHEQKESDIEAMAVKHSTELAEWKAAHDKAVSDNSADHNRELEAARQAQLEQNAKELTALRSEHSQELQKAIQDAGEAADAKHKQLTQELEVSRAAQLQSHKDALAALREQHQKELDDLSKKRDIEIREKLSDLENKLATSQKSHSEQERAIADLQTQHSRELDDLTARNRQESDDRLISQSREIDELRSSKDKHEDDMKTLRESHARELKELTDSHSESIENRIEEALKTNRVELQALKEQLESERTSHADKVEELAATTAQRDSIEKKLQEIQADHTTKISELESNQGNLDAQLASKEAEYAKDLEALRAAKKDIESKLERAFAEHDAAIKALNANKDGLETRSSDLEQQLSAALDAVQSSQRQLVSDHEESESTIQRLKEQMKASEEQVKEVSELRSRTGTLEGQALKSEELVVALRKELEDVKAESERARSAAASAADSHKDVSEQMQALQRRHQEDVQARDEQLELNKATLSQVRDQLTTLTEKHADDDKAASDLNLRFENLQRTHQGLQGEKSNVEQKLNEQIAGLSSQLEQLSLARDAALNSAAERHAGEITRLEGVVTGLQAELQDAGQSKSEAHKAVEIEVSELKEAMGQLQIKLMEVKQQQADGPTPEEVTQLKATIALLEATVQQDQDARADAEKHLALAKEKLEQKVTEHATAMRNLEETHASASGADSASKQELTEELARVSSDFQNQLAKLKIANLDSQAQADETILQLQQEVARQKESLRELEGKSQTNEQKLRDQAAFAEEQLAALQAEYVAAQEKLALAEQKSENVGKKLKQMQEDYVRETIVEIGSLRAANEQVNRQIKRTEVGNEADYGVEASQLTISEVVDFNALRDTEVASLSKEYEQELDYGQEVTPRLRGSLADMRKHEITRLHLSIENYDKQLAQLTDLNPLAKQSLTTPPEALVMANPDSLVKHPDLLQLSYVNKSLADLNGFILSWANVIQHHRDEVEQPDFALLTTAVRQFKERVAEFENCRQNFEQVASSSEYFGSQENSLDLAKDLEKPVETQAKTKSSPSQTYASASQDLQDAQAELNRTPGGADPANIGAIQFSISQLKEMAAAVNDENERMLIQLARIRGGRI